MSGGGDDGARNTESLRNVALHLGPQNQLWLQIRYRALDRQVVVCNERLEAVFGRESAQIAGPLAAVGAQPHHLESHFIPRDSRRRQRVGAIGENKDSFTCEVSRID